MVSVVHLRELLGDVGRRLSDQEVEELWRDAQGLARLLERMVLEKRELERRPAA